MSEEGDEIEEIVEEQSAAEAQTGEGTGKTASKRPSNDSKAEEREGFVAKNQQLFLVEFLVDTVNIDPCGFCDELMEGQTCVTLKFLNFPPMTICEKDFDPNREMGIDKVRFNSGKSLMFAFAEKQCEDPPPMMAELIVSKKCPDGSATDKVDIGRIKVCMVKMFQQVYEVAKFTPDKLPASRSIKDCFMLVGRGKRTTGEMGVYVRLTCLGQNVVTEFQCGSNMTQDPILFKNREGKKVYQFCGTERNEEEREGEQKFQEGCGCLGPAPPMYSGGQGDGGRMDPSKKSGSAGGCAKGSRVTLAIPDMGSRCRGVNGKQWKVKNQMVRSNIGDTRKTKGGLSISQTNTNPDENCFVLRVGDKGQIPDRGKMILEFRTPKQKMLPKILPPYHEDIAVQTDSPKGKGKGKGKKK